MHSLPRDLSQHYERYTAEPPREHKNLKYPRNCHWVELECSHASFSLVLKCGPGLRLLSTFYFSFPPPMAPDSWAKGHCLVQKTTGVLTFLGMQEGLQLCPELKYEANGKLKHFVIGNLKTLESEEKLGYPAFGTVRSKRGRAAKRMCAARSKRQFRQALLHRGWSQAAHIPPSLAELPQLPQVDIVRSSPLCTTTDNSRSYFFLCCFSF